MATATARRVSLVVTRAGTAHTLGPVGGRGQRGGGVRRGVPRQGAAGSSGRAWGAVEQRTHIVSGKEERSAVDEWSSLQGHQIGRRSSQTHAGSDPLAVALE